MHSLTNTAPQDYTIYSNIQGLEDLKRQAREDERAALKPVAQQFEALFVEMILKQARQVKFDDGWLEGEHADFYLDMYDKQLAQDLSAKGTLGFADQIVKQLTPSIPSLNQQDTQAWLAQRQLKVDEITQAASQKTAQK